MSNTHHHRARHNDWRDPAPYRRAHMKRWKTRCKHLTRIGKYDALPPLRQKFGYNW